MPQTDCKNLILIPTELEQQQLQGHPPAMSRVEICGFGPIAAAANTALLLSSVAPQRVVLIGVAGSYSDDLQVGRAFEFSRVSCFGIGVGSGHEFKPAHAVGWKQSATTIGDRIQLPSQQNRELLTVCSAAAGPADVDFRLSHFPNSLAEEMEGFAVAMACQLVDVPLTIIRGISNQAGDRRMSNWDITSAMKSAWELALELLEDE